MDLPDKSTAAGDFSPVSTGESRAPDLSEKLPTRFDQETGRESQEGGMHLNDPRGCRKAVLPTVLGSGCAFRGPQENDTASLLTRTDIR